MYEGIAEYYVTGPFFIMQSSFQQSEASLTSCALIKSQEKKPRRNFSYKTFGSFGGRGEWKKTVKLGVFAKQERVKADSPYKFSSYRPQSTAVGPTYHW